MNKEYLMGTQEAAQLLKIDVRTIQVGIQLGIHPYSLFGAAVRKPGGKNFSYQICRKAFNDYYGIKGNAEETEDEDN